MTEPALPRVKPPPSSGPARPLLSVMIPTYEPGPFLIEALRSVLSEDPGADRVQIAIVDDASPKARVAELVLGASPPGRIEIHHHDTNAGLAGNWNRAIDLARGEFVHILHQDDYILPGFHASVLRGLTERPEAGMAFSRHAFVDDRGGWTRRSHRERWQAGLLSSWLARISRRQRIQCPAAVVRRSVYESLGGFRADLAYALDWEMWVRIAARYGVWYEPRVLACYRRHGASETQRLTASGRIGGDLLRTIEAFSLHIPEQWRSSLTEGAYRQLFASQLRDGRRLLAAGETGLACRQLETARNALERVGEGIGKRLRMQQLMHLERRCGIVKAD